MSGEMDFSLGTPTPESIGLLRMVGGAPSSLKEACEEWLIPRLRLFISGYALSQTGGHGDFRAKHDHHLCTSGFVSGITTNVLKDMQLSEEAVL
ncbi:hypothetical protein BDV29DRAFT_152065 [Aspergillus leporis]|uniref:Uncharacterized protein n=1 Tax=Aspergillus leporis TaxID=41062 RepID=A0A5N5XI12_9EURO|nr:hypothetical protein BDV29DRAFT_152065 [Aspergillus leporis]